jgi:hypothetical protein
MQFAQNWSDLEKCSFGQLNLLVRLESRSARREALTATETLRRPRRACQLRKSTHCAWLIQRSREAILVGGPTYFSLAYAVLRCVLVSGRVDVQHAAVMLYGVLHITAQRAHARAVVKVLCGKSPSP